MHIPKHELMRDRSSTSTILIILVLVITFPIWLTLGGVFFGVIAGLFGALLGVFGAVFGVLMAVITLPFRILFGGWHHDMGYFHFRDHTMTIVAIILIVALLVRRQRSAS